ncbi:MAG: hypothetical protein Q7R93_00200 [bacterium]|nr:hypothetical protein [bacterium]
MPQKYAHRHFLIAGEGLNLKTLRRQCRGVFYTLAVAHLNLLAVLLSLLFARVFFFLVHG